MRLHYRGRTRWTDKDNLIQLLRCAMHKNGKRLRVILKETKRYRVTKTSAELRRLLKKEEAGR